MTTTIEDLINDYTNIHNELIDLRKGLEEDGYYFEDMSRVQYVLHTIEPRIPDYVSFPEVNPDELDLKVVINSLYKDQFDTKSDKELLLNVWDKVTSEYKLFYSFNEFNKESDGLYKKVNDLLVHEKLRSPLEIYGVKDTTLPDGQLMLLFKDHKDDKTISRIINSFFLPGSLQDDELTWVNKLIEFSNKD